MKKIIVLDGLMLMVSIGIHDFEKAALQPYRVDVRLELSRDYWTHADQIVEAVDYDALRESIVTHLTGAHFNLQETVAQDLFGLCFALDARVIAATVRTAKTQVYADCASVGLEYEMTRNEWATRTGF